MKSELLSLFSLFAALARGSGNAIVDYTLSGANWRDEMCVKGRKQSPIDIPSIDGGKKNFLDDTRNISAERN